MIEEVKLVEWRQNVEARRSFSWAVVQQLLDEVSELRGQVSETSGLTVVELPADCPIWGGRACEFLAPAASPEPVGTGRAGQRAMGVGGGL